MLLDTPICDFGWKAPSFELKDPNDQLYHFDDLMGEKGLLIAFICNHCPYVHAIIDRLVSDVEALKGDGINAVAVMANDYQNYTDDSPDNMKIFAREHSMDFPYLVDETQEVAKAYDAVCTPDFFGLNNKGELQYRGRLDNAKREDASNRNPELLQAMRQIAETGQGPEKQYPSMGCSIKWRG